MSAKRGRSRNSGAVSDKRENDKKGSPDKSEPESEKPEMPTVFEYETEDGLKVKIDPFEAEISREYELSENDIVEFSAGIDWSPTDFKLERVGGGVSLSGEIGLPGDLLGVSGGVSVDLATGEIIGGEIGAEFGGADVEFSVSGEDACQKSISVSYLGIGVSYTRDDCDPEENKDRKPPQGRDSPPRREKPISPDEIRRLKTWSLFYPNCYISVVLIGTFFNVLKSTDPLVVETEITGGIGIEVPSRLFYDATDFFGGGVTGLHGERTGFNDDGSFFRLWTEKYPNGESDRPGTILSATVHGFRTSPSSLDGPGAKFAVENYSFFSAHVSTCWAGLIVPRRRYDLKERIPPSPPPRRIMNDCCSNSIRLTREIHTHLGIPELRDKGVKFPNRLMAVGGKGYTKVDTILDLMELMIREIDHLGIHPHTVKIKDAKPGVKGDQPVTETNVNATAWAKKLMEANIKSGGEGDARLNLQVRLARLLLQTFTTVISAKYKADAIANFLGVPVQEDTVSPPVPFDVTLGLKAKGFGTQPKDKDKIKALSQEKIAKLLDQFLAETTQDVTVEKFATGEQSLLELLQQLVQQI